MEGRILMQAANLFLSRDCAIFLASFEFEAVTKTTR